MDVISERLRKPGPQDPRPAVRVKESVRRLICSRRGPQPRQRGGQHRGESRREDALRRPRRGDLPWIDPEDLSGVRRHERLRKVRAVPVLHPVVQCVVSATGGCRQLPGDQRGGTADAYRQRRRVAELLPVERITDDVTVSQDAAAPIDVGHRDAPEPIGEIAPHPPLLGGRRQEPVTTDIDLMAGHRRGARQPSHLTGVLDDGYRRPGGHTRVRRGEPGRASAHDKHVDGLRSAVV